MKVLCVRQPWAHAIIHHGKNIENRSWATPYRGPLLIGASAGKVTPKRLDAIKKRLALDGLNVDFAPDEFQYGGIIGMVDLVDSIPGDTFLSRSRPNTYVMSKSLWYTGDVGWVLKNPRPLPFMPIKGKLRLFDPEPNVKAKLKKLGLP